MILKFRFKNVFSYRDDAEFSMLAPNNRVKNRYEDNYINICGYDVLKTAIIVGENAGGKSNFIRAIKYFLNFFDSNNYITPLPSTLFAAKRLNQEQIKKENLTQEFELLISSANKDKIYKYELTISNYGIEKEVLSYQKFKNEKFNKVFEFIAKFKKEHKKNQDDKSVLHVENSITIPSFSKEQYGTLKPILEKKERTGLMVNALSMLAVDGTANFIESIRNTYVNRNELDLPLNLYCEILDENFIKSKIEILKKKEFLDIFKLVDSSIESINVDEDKPCSNTIINRRIDGTIYEWPILRESSGVKQFLVFSLVLYLVIYENKVTFADEMDSMFNPVLTAKVINYLHAVDTNGQFVFTTHNVFNMNFRLFMKEQMYITAKNKLTLSSKLYSLSEFKNLRYDSNEKIYEYYMMGVLGGAGGDNYE